MSELERCGACGALKYAYPCVCQKQPEACSEQEVPVNRNAQPTFADSPDDSVRDQHISPPAGAVTVAGEAGVAPRHCPTCTCPVKIASLRRRYASNAARQAAYRARKRGARAGDEA